MRGEREWKRREQGHNSIRHAQLSCCGRCCSCRVVSSNLWIVYLCLSSFSASDAFPFLSFLDLPSSERVLGSAAESEHGAGAGDQTGEEATAHAAQTATDQVADHVQLRLDHTGGGHRVRSERGRRQQCSKCWLTVGLPAPSWSLDRFVRSLLERGTLPLSATDGRREEEAREQGVEGARCPFELTGLKTASARLRDRSMQCSGSAVECMQWCQRGVV